MLNNPILKPTATASADTKRGIDLLTVDIRDSVVVPKLHISE
jgi:hypothetical protein